MSLQWIEPTGSSPRRPRQVSDSPVRNRIDLAIERAAGALFAQQKVEGFWCGELLADTTLESDYILLQLWLHQPEGAVWNPPTLDAH